MKTKILSAAMTFALLLCLVPTETAEARHGWRGRRCGGHHHQRHRGHRGYRHGYNNNCCGSYGYGGHHNIGGWNGYSGYGYDSGGYGHYGYGSGGYGGRGAGPYFHM